MLHRNGQKFVDETVARIQQLSNNGELNGTQYGFLTYLLSKEGLTYKDLSVITLSLFADGLSTVKTIRPAELLNKNLRFVRV